MFESKPFRKLVWKHKYWGYLLAGIGLVISGLVTAILWKVQPSQPPETALPQPTGIIQPPNPINTIHEFYAALKTHRCAEAIKIRPDYKGCQDIDDVSSINVTPLQIDTDKAAVQLEVTFTKKGQPTLFKGYAWLQRTNDGQWQIPANSFATKNSITPEKFLTDIAGIQPKPLLAIAPSPLSQSLPVTSGQPDITNTHSFGSQLILDSCWTQEQLRGIPTDNRITDNKHTPDATPPARQYPHLSPAPLPAHLQGSIRSVRLPDPNKKLVALTFDLCERTTEVTGYDASIINYLRDHHIKATFYAGGKWMRSHPDKTQQLMADPLFEIGNHAWTHGNMRVLQGDEMKTQVLWTQAQYELLRENLAEKLQQCGVPTDAIQQIPPIPLSFRYPYGTCSTESLSFMESYGLPSVQWNIVTADPWHKQTADGIAKTIVQGIKPGSIIIAHANGRGWKTSDALPQFIPALQERGYQFVTVTELLASGREVEATDTCYELKPGDNQFYDQKVGKGTE